MTQMTTTMTMTILKTITVLYTEQAVIRVQARVDMPEYGLQAGQTIYLVRSSRNDGTYYIVAWNYEQIRWVCRCPATVPNCRHVRAVNTALAGRAAYKKAREALIAQRERDAKMQKYQEKRAALRAALENVGLEIILSEVNGISIQRVVPVSVPTCCPSCGEETCERCTDCHNGACVDAVPACDAPKHWEEPMTHAASIEARLRLAALMR